MMNKALTEDADFFLSAEKGAIYKKRGGRISVCLVSPNTYPVGMSSLGYQGIYGLLNDRGDVVCERSFLPDRKNYAEHVRSNTPLFSFESKRLLSSFDIVAFSVSFENDYPNILKILDLARIPIRSSERNRRHPLLIAGGACCFFNPEPVAGIFDAVFVGEAEKSLNEFIDLFLVTSGITEASRTSFLERAPSIEGVYVPSQHPGASDGWPDVRRTHHDNIAAPSLKAPVVTPHAEFSGMRLVEVMRGCPWSCRFCLVGSVYGKPRIKPLDVVRREIGDAAGEADRIGLVGPSLIDYPYIGDVLGIEGVEFSLSSLRADERAPALAECMRERRSVAIAPESGTDRLRRVLGKKITEAGILAAAEAMFRAGVENLRLYFMVGLPTETEEDISGIVALARKIRAVSPSGTVVLSLSTFVPKPFTPFQWHMMDRLPSVQAKLRLVKSELRRERGIRVFHDVPKYALMQGLFALGDRGILEVILKMRDSDDWLRACGETGTDYGWYIHRLKGENERFPWDFIRYDIPREKLYEEYLKALT